MGINFWAGLLWQKKHRKLVELPAELTFVGFSRKTQHLQKYHYVHTSHFSYGGSQYLNWEASFIETAT